MRKIYSFKGMKEVNLLSKEDYRKVEEELFDNNYRDILILTKSDLNSAIENGCRIYCKTFKDEEGYSIKKYFIRIDRNKLFGNAEK